MYQYIDTFFIENVSMCRYKYILKVSDTYTVSDTKGLSILIIYHFPLQMFFSYLIYAIAYQEFPCAFFIGYILYFWTKTFWEEKKISLPSEFKAPSLLEKLCQFLCNFRAPLADIRKTGLICIVHKSERHWSSSL